MFLDKLLLWGVNQICVFSFWHELPVPNVQVFLFLCSLIKSSSVVQISWVDICSLCWKHLITLVSVNYWKWDSYSLTLHHSFGSWLFLNALRYYWKWTCQDMSGHGIPLLVLLVAELLEFFTPFLTVDYLLALDCLVLT